MNAIHTALRVAEQTLGLGIIVFLLFGAVFLLAVLPTLMPGAVLVGVADRRLARPDPMDRVAVRRRRGVVLATFAAAVLAGMRATMAFHADKPEPAWGTALIVAGLLQLGTAVVTLRRDAPWRPTKALVAELGWPFAVGLGLVYARPLLALIG